MSKYAVVFEKSKTGYSAYAPDLPDRIATGKTLELTWKRMQEAVGARFQAMREDGPPIPEPTSYGCRYQRRRLSDETDWTMLTARRFPHSLPHPNTPLFPPLRNLVAIPRPRHANLKVPLIIEWIAPL
jgi:predicted RNase H-like HicB family nuclease